MASWNGGGGLRRVGGRTQGLALAGCETIHGMHLSQVQLTNYRAFPIAVLTLPPAGVVLIAGANNSGKSALLSALDATLRGTSYPNMGYAGTTEPLVTLRFSLEEGERVVFVEFARLQRGVDLGSDTFSWVDLTFSFNGANMVLTSVAVQWTNNNPLIVARHDADCGPP